MKEYVPYYRVSTKSQGGSGLGLEAQRASVRRHIGEGSIIEEFTEIESGKNIARRKLNEAVELCKSTGATLIIAKLDRLSRNASFTLALLNSKVKFLAVDMPNANHLTIGIMSIIAEDEAKRISERTTSALRIKSMELAKVGKKLGTPENLTDEARRKSIISRRESAKNNENNRKAYALISMHKKTALHRIAKHLNSSGFKTSRGCEFTPSAVKRIKDLYNV